MFSYQSILVSIQANTSVFVKGPSQTKISGLRWAYHLSLTNTAVRLYGTVTRGLPQEGAATF